jgi:hypothetical protein
MVQQIPWSPCSFLTYSPDLLAYSVVSIVRKIVMCVRKGNLLDSEVDLLCTNVEDYSKTCRVCSSALSQIAAMALGFLVWRGDFIIE